MVLVSLLGMTMGRAQPVVRWAKTAGSERYDFCTDMALSPPGVLYLAGQFDTANATRPEVVLYRFDPEGAQLDSQISRGEQIRGVTVDAAGSYYLTGRVWDPDRLGQGKHNDLYLGKFSSSGKLLWERTLGSSGTEARRLSEGGHDVALDKNGNILVVGGSANVARFGDVTFPNTPGGPLLCKFDPNGQLLWAKRVEGRHQVYQGQILGSGIANHLALDPQGNIILTGYLFNGPTDFGGKTVNVASPDTSDSFVAKFSAGGEVQWVQVGYGYGGLAVDRQSNIYFNGSTSGNTAMRCGKMSAAGELVWERKIRGAYGVGVALNAAFEPVFVGEFEGTLDLDGHTLESASGTYQKLLICSATADGQFRWALGDGGRALSRAWRVVTDDDGRIFVAGDVQCYWREGLICESGHLDSFELPPPSSEGTTDLVLARLDEPVVPRPQLKVARAGSGLLLSWPTSATGYILESTDALPAANWSAVPETPSVAGNQNVVTVTAGSGARFYRLRKP